MEEYRGGRDVASMKEFVVTMKAKAATAVDVGNEGVPAPKHDSTEQQQQQRLDTAQEDADRPSTVALPRQVHLAAVFLILVCLSVCLSVSTIAQCGSHHQHCKHC